MKQKRKNFMKHAIARYWVEWGRDHCSVPPWDKFGWDSGEPSCMACGFWKEAWDNKPTFYARWNSTNLEKCHVVPLYMGGADQLSNMVLMCGECHDAQPDSANPEDTYAYMRERNLLDRTGLASAILAAQSAVAQGATVEAAATHAIDKLKIASGKVKS